MTESSSFEIVEVARFTTGTVGPRGARTFFLQVVGPLDTVSMKLEKQQVQALAEYLDTMMVDLPDPESAALPVDLELAEPIIPVWVVASLGVAWNEERRRITLWAEELLTTDDPDDVEPANGRFEITLEQARAFVQRATRVVGDGRPPCPFCGAPVADASGWCACAN